MMTMGITNHGWPQSLNSEKYLDITRCGYFNFAQTVNGGEAGKNQNIGTSKDALATMSVIENAKGILRVIEDTDIPGRKAPVQPYRFLSAMLAHAPTSLGNDNVAKDIVTERELAVSNGDLVSRLERL